MKSGTVRAGDIELAFDTFGRESGPAIVLVMGNSAPGLVWPDEFCEQLADSDYRVIRYDQRDTGLSGYVDFDRQPYSLHDLVDDAFYLLDMLGIQRAHFVGLSQGANIAYLAGQSRPLRIASITAIMSSPDLRPKNNAFTGIPAVAGELPQPASDYVKAVIALNETRVSSDEEAAVRFMENFRLAAGPTSPFDEDFWLELGTKVACRTGDNTKMANHSNHSKAQIATAPLSAGELQKIVQPCLIVHGDMDPIFPLAHAHWAIANLKNVEHRFIKGMGHALDPAFFDEITTAVRRFLTSTKA